MTYHYKLQYAGEKKKSYSDELYLEVHIKVILRARHSESHSNYQAPQVGTSGCSQRTSPSGAASLPGPLPFCTQKGARLFEKLTL